MIQNDDTISRQAAKEAVRMVVKDLPTRTETNILINDLPSAQPERKEGEWKTNIYAFGEDRYECDQCHETALHCYDFCPNCGADMREG